jgi:hypothetical protein
MSKTTCSPSLLQLSLATILALSLAPHAQSAAPGTITVAKTVNLDFGPFVVLPSCSNCSITVPLTGPRTATAGIVLIDKLGSGALGQFSVTCNSASCSFTVSTPAAVTMSAGGVNMTVGGYTVTRTSTTTPSTVSVGGTLTIPRSGSLPNTYTKTFTLVTSP